MHLPSQRPLPTRSSFIRDRCAPIVFSDSPPTSPCCQGLGRATSFSKTHQPETRKRQELLGAGEPSRTTHPATLQRSQLLLHPAPRPPPLPLCSPARHQILRFQEHRILADLLLEMPEPHPICSGLSGPPQQGPGLGAVLEPGMLIQPPRCHLASPGPAGPISPRYRASRRQESPGTPAKERRVPRGSSLRNA